ncbi:MAG TPA: gamma-glutamyltransferase [Gemmataceae bacterium]|jgi:gamma-glutamyltranspeptidase/glutathione hydrolase
MSISVRVLLLTFAASIFAAAPGTSVSAQVPDKLRPDTQARSVVMTKLGIVATSQPLASRAGTQILEAGGNAIDAAIAANAVLGLVEPTSNGIGGDLFAIVYEAKTGKVYGLNSSGWAPRKLTIDLLQEKGNKKMPEKGIHSVTVPGCVAGWDALRKRFGTQEFSTLLKPAIYYAEEGFPVTELISNGWRSSAKSLAAHPNSKETYLPNSEAPKAGEVFRNPDLANSFKLIAEKGRDGYYKGRIAEAIVKISEEQGGTFELADLEEFQPEWVEPLSTTYRGWTVYELPPNGQGIAALSMLNLLEQSPLAEYGHNSAKALHAMIEAKKLAYADMLHYVGDPKFGKIPVKQMLSKELAEKRAKEIDPDKAHESVMPSEFEDFKRKAGHDTIYMCTVDKDGNMVSLIQSNYMGFGSGLVPPKCGFMLHNRGALFTLEKDRPNSLEPRKRPLHTIIPAFMEKDGVRIAFGIMGGWNQAQAHAQFVADLVDFKLNIQAALESPRFTKMTFEGLDVKLESRIPESVRADLASRGHKVEMEKPFSMQMGAGQAVMRDAKGVNYGASDPRRDGCAIPEAPLFPEKPRSAVPPR